MAVVSISDARAIFIAIGNDILAGAKWIIVHRESSEIPQQIVGLGKYTIQFVDSIQQKEAPFYYFKKKTIEVCQKIAKIPNFDPSTIGLLACEAFHSVSILLQLLSNRGNRQDEYTTPDFMNRWKRRDIPFIKHFLEIAGYSTRINLIISVALQEDFFYDIAEPILLYHFQFLPPGLKSEIESVVGNPALTSLRTSSEAWESQDSFDWDEKSVSREQILLSIVESLQERKWDIAEVLIRTNLNKLIPEDLSQIAARFTDDTPAVLRTLVQRL